MPSPQHGNIRGLPLRPWQAADRRRSAPAAGKPRSQSAHIRGTAEFSALPLAPNPQKQHPSCRKGGFSEPMPKKTEPGTGSAGTMRVGPAGWSYADWAGIGYPPRKPRGFHEAAYLPEFFDTIEITTSFFHPLRPDHYLTRVA